MILRLQSGPVSVQLTGEDKGNSAGLREELRTGRIADFEFQLWECWESDDSVPGATDLTIQMAVSNVCRGLAKKTLEPKYATALLYGLQVASTTVKKPAAAKAKTKR